jgi:hypothetical protein
METPGRKRRLVTSPLSGSPRELRQRSHSDQIFVGMGCPGSRINDLGLNIVADGEKVVY